MLAVDTCEGINADELQATYVVIRATEAGISDLGPIPRVVGFLRSAVATARVTTFETT